MRTPSGNEDVSDRRSRIVESAGAAFLRYGFARTSMADIVTQAGVSRTALYHYFASKEEVLLAVVDSVHKRSHEAAAQALEQSRSLQTALTDLLDAKFGRTLALLADSHHGSELVDATHHIAGSATRAADAAFQALVVQAFTRYGHTAAKANDDADTLVAAAKGLMRAGDVLVSPARFKKRLARLVVWVTR